MSSPRFGIIGGGQLGKLLIERGFSSDDWIRVYSPELPLCNPDRYKQWVQGRLDDRRRLVEFGSHCDVLTYEIESVSVEALKEIRKAYGISVYPSPEVLEVIQNKTRQKTFLRSIDILTPYSVSYSSIQEVTSIPEEELYKFINKTQEGGYDGYGVKTVTKMSDCFPVKGMLEARVSIEKELSVIIARDIRGGMMCFPVVEMVMGSDHKLAYSITPARIADHVIQECQRIARVIAEKINLVGIMAIEFFLEKESGKILVNEMAPRPHNSGHQTIEYCRKSQYDILAMIMKQQEIAQYIQVTKPPLHGVNNVCVLKNIIGTGSFRKPKLTFDAQSLKILHNGVKIHDYRKEWSRPGRKLGHIVIVMDSDQLELWIDQIETCGAPRVRVDRPRVAVIMGSKSDYDVVDPCLDVLDDFGVHYLTRVVSAHRDSSEMLAFGESAFDEGYEVIVAAAGGAAHLPGMIASATILPVIGIPVKSSNSIDGWDSLLSIAQMPGGIPVATMGLNGAKNAGLMAVRILATVDNDLRHQLKNYQNLLREKVRNQNHELRLLDLQGKSIYTGYQSSSISRHI